MSHRFRPGWHRSWYQGDHGNNNVNTLCLPQRFLFVKASPRMAGGWVLQSVVSQFHITSYLTQVEALRYPLLLVLGASHTGKTEWAKSLFRNPLELKVGTLEHFPETMRDFDRQRHDGLVLDDVRDLKFLSDHQDKLQGKYDSLVEFASTPGGTCAYTKYLYAVPTVVTFNHSTANLQFLLVHDWLKHEKNRILVDFPAVLGVGSWSV